MTMKEKIREAIKNAFIHLYGSAPESIPVSYPENRDFGDFATPAALSYAKNLRKNPREIAQAIADALKPLPDFAKVEIAGPGFVNFFLSDAVIDSEIRKLAFEPDYGKNDSQKDRRILLEYVSANPTGPLHIGHGRWGAIGDSMARILRFCGAELSTEFYVNDAGNQVKLLNESIKAVREGRDVPENGYHGEYIKEVAQRTGDPAEILLAEQKQTLSRFRVEFDNYFSEKSLHSSNAVIESIEELKKRGVAYEQDGALWFRTTDYGDDKDRVLIKADGEYTYFCVDIAYHLNKVRRNYNELITVLGADHHGYIKRLEAAVQVFSESTKLRVLIGQLVNLFRNGEPVRMSKRTGDMIMLDEVVDEIGVDATRYYMVMRKNDTHLDFDLEIAKKQSEDNPVFYVQYAHARISGILRNAAEQVGWKGSAIDTGTIAECKEGRELAIELIRFPEAVIDAAEALEPHRMPQYLEGLAAVFHRFYNANRVISDNAETTKRRLILTEAMGKTLRTGLGLLGVSAPERM